MAVARHFKTGICFSFKMTVNSFPFPYSSLYKKKPEHGTGSTGLNFFHLTRLVSSGLEFRESGTLFSFLELKGAL